MTHRRPASESGFTLLELMLVVGVAAIVFLGITKITQSWVDSESASGAGQHLGRVSQLTQKYIEARFNVLTPTIDAVAEGATPGSPWEDYRLLLQQEGLLDATGSLRSTFNIPMRVAFVVDSSTGTNIYRSTIYTTGNMPNKRALQAARQAGNTGGTITVMPNAPTTANTAVGAFGQWRVPVAGLAPAAMPVPPTFPCERTDTRGCLVAVISYSEQTLCGPYLYRTEVEGRDGSNVICSNGNTMNAALNMNGNDITNASDITTANLTVNDNTSLGTTNVTGNSNFNGPVTASRGMTVNDGMTVSGQADYSSRVNMSGGGTMNVATLNANRVQSDIINTNNLNSGNMNVQGTMNVENNLTVEGNVNVNGSNAVFANTVNAGTVNGTGGQINVGTMTVYNNMDVNGGMRINGTGTLAADKIISPNCMVINGQNYGPGC